MTAEDHSNRLLAQKKLVDILIRPSTAPVYLINCLGLEVRAGTRERETTVGKSIESRLSSLGGENASNAGAAQAPLSRRRLLVGSAALLAGGALVATPGLAKAHNPSSATDIDILNFALTLEHLEYAFYRDGLKTFSAADIKNSKFLRGDGKRFVRNSAYGYLQLIRDHEDTHVDTLTSVIQSLNGTPVPEATYNFKTTAFTSPQKFLNVARLLENTGVTAYDGAIAHIEAANLLTAGATIATVEARHASYLNLITGEVPFPDAFDTPVAPRDVFDAASGFIASTPEPYGPYPSATAFRELLPTTVIQ